MAAQSSPLTKTLSLIFSLHAALKNGILRIMMAGL